MRCRVYGVFYLKHLYMTLTPEQDNELTKIQSINIAAKAIAQAAFLIGVSIDELLPMAAALAAKELKKLKDE